MGRNAKWNKYIIMAKRIVNGMERNVRMERKAGIKRNKKECEMWNEWRGRKCNVKRMNGLQTQHQIIHTFVC